MGVFHTVAYHSNRYDIALYDSKKQSFHISKTTETKQPWLGDGIYFWDNISDAYWWSGDTVLSAHLTCSEDRFANFDNPEEWKKFIDYSNYVAKVINIDNIYTLSIKGNSNLVASFLMCIRKHLNFSC